jgi:ABC-type branched-subunit amino acid transport system ATPase component
MGGFHSDAASRCPQAGGASLETERQVQMALAEPSLAVRGLTKRFGGVVALQDVGFELAPGHCLGVVGGNGAGKTTFLNCLSGIEQPTSGTVRINGTDVTSLTPDKVAAIGVARSFQLAEHFREMLAWEFVALGHARTQRRPWLPAALGLRSGRRAERDLRDRAIDTLFAHGIEAWDTPLGSLPYGVQKSVDLLRVFSSDPTVALLDEPTSGSSQSELAKIEETIADRKAHRNGSTTVIVDHDADFITRLCDEVLVLEWGEQLAYGPTADVMARDDVAAVYSGTPNLQRLPE